MALRHVLLLLIVVTASIAAPTHQPRKASSVASDSIHRVRRQDTTSTTASPPKRRPSNIFSLFSVLLGETRDDARRAFSEISKLFNSQFRNSSDRPTTTPAPLPVTPSGPAMSSTVDGEDVTTTTEPYRITREEFNGILRGNFRGIVNLFGREFSNAIRDSNKNVLQFGRDFREQIRPYVTG